MEEEGKKKRRNEKGEKRKWKRGCSSTMDCDELFQYLVPIVEARSGDCRR